MGDTAYALDLLDVQSNIVRSDNHLMTSYFLDQWLRKANGVVLIFDLTSKATFDHIVGDGHLRLCMSRRTHNSQEIPYSCGGQRFGCVLVGTKADLAAENREVDRELAEEWAQSQGIAYIELDQNQPDLIEKTLEVLIRSILDAERRDARDVDRVNRNRRRSEKKTDKKSLDRMSSLTQSFRTAFRK